MSLAFSSFLCITALSNVVFVASSCIARSVMLKLEIKWLTVVHGLVVEKEGKEGCFVGSTGDLAGNHPGCKRERVKPHFFFFFSRKSFPFLSFLAKSFFFFALVFSSPEFLFFGLSLYVFPISGFLSVLLVCSLFSREF